eukprot:6739241-Alexandrium_andersonii.AAC.1
MMLAKDENRMLCEVLLASARPLTTWEGHANKINRSSLECQQWATQQSTGAFMQHLNDMVKGLSDVSVLESCSFVLRRQFVEDEHLPRIEQEFADLMGRAAMVLVGLRLRRGL